MMMLMMVIVASNSSSECTRGMCKNDKTVIAALIAKKAKWTKAGIPSKSSGECRVASSSRHFYKALKQIYKWNCDGLFRTIFVICDK